MKSLSKIYSRVADEQLKSWDIADLEVELEQSPHALDMDQILTLFRNENQNSSGERETSSSSTLHRAGIGLSLTHWQPGEIELESPRKVEEKWLFAETFNNPDEDAEEESWEEEADFEKESTKKLAQAGVRAEEILLNAQAEADQIILQAQAVIEQEKKDGYQQGWDDARNEMQVLLRAAGAIVHELQKWQADLMSQGEQTIIEMLKEIAQTMFGEGVHLDANALQMNLNRIMEHAQRLGDLNIFLNPRDADLLDPSWKEYQFLISGNKVRVIPSEKITPGGCIVKGNTGMVDGRVETQLAAILSKFDELRETAQ